MGVCQHILNHHDDVMLLLSWTSGKCLFHEHEGQLERWFGWQRGFPYDRRELYSTDPHYRTENEILKHYNDFIEYWDSFNFIGVHCRHYEVGITMHMEHDYITVHMYFIPVLKWRLTTFLLY